MQSLIQRAVDANLIDSVSWNHVARWELLGSDALEEEPTLVPISTGKMPQPVAAELAKRHSVGYYLVLHLKRGLELVTIQPWTVRHIAEKYQGGTRDSYPLPPTETSLMMPAQVWKDDFHSHLPFVNRKQQVDDCVSHFANQFDHAYSSTTASKHPRENYQMLIAAGGPGIGKTTWARYAFVSAAAAAAEAGLTEEASSADSASDSSSSSPPHARSAFHRSLAYTHRHRAMYRIKYEPGDIKKWELDRPDLSIAARLLHAHLGLNKHMTWSDFATANALAYCGDLSLRNVVDVILHRGGEERRVVVVNFDEVHGVLKDNDGKKFMKGVLSALVDSVEFCYFCVLLTSTHALEVLQLSSLSGIRHKSVSLPLLTVPHMYKVVWHVAKLCLAGEQDSAPTADPDSAALYKAVKTATRPSGASIHFTRLLELLSGVPRFLEKTLFEMGKERTSDGRHAFSRRVFLRNVLCMDDSAYVFDELLPTVVEAIVEKYSGFRSHLDSFQIFPVLVTCSLFGAVFNRSDWLRWEDDAGNEHSRSVTSLEESGIIFLTDPPAPPQPPLRGRHEPYCLPTKRPTLTQQSGLPLTRIWRSPPPAREEKQQEVVQGTEEGTGDEDDGREVDSTHGIVVPFIWVHLMAARRDISGLHNHGQLLSQLGTTLTPSEREKLSMSTVILRTSFLAQCGRTGNGLLMRISVYDMFPLPAEREIEPAWIEIPRLPTAADSDFVSCLHHALTIQRYGIERLEVRAGRPDSCAQAVTEA